MILPWAKKDKGWQRKEKNDSKSFGGKRRPRSGGIWFMPADVVTKDFLIDDKTTKHNSYSITSKTWKKLVNESMLCDKMPVLNVRLGDGIEFTVIDTNDFKTWFKEKK